MYRRKKEEKHFPYTSISITLIFILVVLILFLTIKLLKTQNQQADDKIKQEESSFSQKEDSISRDKSSAETEKKETESKSHTKAEENDQSTVEVTDLEQFDYLNGKYDLFGHPYTINFQQRSVIIQGFEEQIYDSIDKVLKHPDGSLVINIHGKEDSQQDNGKIIKYRSLLLAPAGIKVKENWQTKENIDDNSDTGVSRLAVAESNDNGKSFEMTPAYQAFENNDSDKIYILKK
ncbi:hypothetical protein [Xylocopilactobacillus apis]|uniref:Uncharacterized protein n=1 Tax=Xylocopilactobacillus apis TaxID=2932183 RepID=A0AAU9DN57_9LACO|nr:hypothetical protein [Xylocopilactobacillus apis]BDR57139.1 hypothetical protein KIMC2_17010 [Xylocopilactobacillus apis]